MFEVATGIPPFNGRKHDVYLQLDILDGVRPTIHESLPPEYEALMNRCWDANPENRPTANDLAWFFYDQCKMCSNNPSHGSAFVILNAMRGRSQINSSQSSTYPIIPRDAKIGTYFII